MESSALPKLLKDGRYRVQQTLRKQAGRQTLLAQDTQTGTPVIIKLLSFSENFQWADLRLFEREAKILQTLDHPSIPRYLDAFDLDLPESKNLALVKTFVEGQTLDAYLQSGRTFTESDLIQLAQQLLDILDYLHSHNPAIIHRDIKPSNILLSDRTAHSVGQLHLVDFGSVQAPATQEQGTLTIVGTYGYMPPEQFGGRATPASDLYSLGATIIYLATGQHPADLPQKDLRIQFESDAPQLSAGLTSWLKWMTHPSLEQRPTTAAEAKNRLDNLESFQDSTEPSSLVGGTDAVTIAETSDTVTPTAVPLVENSLITVLKTDGLLEVMIPIDGRHTTRPRANRYGINPRILVPAILQSLIFSPPLLMASFFIYIAITTIISISFEMDESAFESIFFSTFTLVFLSCLVVLAGFFGCYRNSVCLFKLSRHISGKRYYRFDNARNAGVSLENTSPLQIEGNSMERRQWSQLQKGMSFQASNPEKYKEALHLETTNNGTEIWVKFRKSPCKLPLLINNSVFPFSDYEFEQLGQLLSDWLQLPIVEKRASKLSRLMSSW